MKENDNVVLTEEQMQKEEKINALKMQVQSLFPENVVSREGRRVVVNSTSEMFLFTELNRIEGVCAINNMCYYVRASVKNGLQAVIY